MFTLIFPAKTPSLFSGSVYSPTEHVPDGLGRCPFILCYLPGEATGVGLELSGTLCTAWLSLMRERRGALQIEAILEGIPSVSLILLSHHTPHDVT